MSILDSLDSFLKLLHLDLNLTSTTKTEDINIRLGGKKHSVTIDKSSHQTNVFINLHEAKKQFPLETNKIINEVLQDVDVKQIIDVTAEESIKKFIRSDTTGKHREVLETLRKVIPSGDINILRASLHLRRLFEADEKSISTLKEDIGSRWGQRGRNIANLCTAGYFESLIIPYYEKTKDMPDGQKSFKEFYETVVSEKAFSVFVPGGMKDQELKYEIINQSIRNVIYHQRLYVNIHAIGKDNVEKVQGVVTNLEKNPPLFEFGKGKRVEIIDKRLDVTGEIISVKLTFNVTDLGDGKYLLQ